MTVSSFSRESRSFLRNLSRKIRAVRAVIVLPVTAVSQTPFNPKKCIKIHITASGKKRERPKDIPKDVPGLLTAVKNAVSPTSTHIIRYVKEYSFIALKLISSRAGLSFPTKRDIMLFPKHCMNKKAAAEITAPAARTLFSMESIRFLSLAP